MIFRLINLSLVASCLLLPLLAQAQTIIESEGLEMDGGEERNEFTFTGGVRVVSEELLLTCDTLHVVASRETAPKATVGQINAIESIVATGNVEIHQGGRIAYAGKAEVEPQSGTLILSEQPRIVDENATIEGWRIILNRETRTAQVLPEPNQGAGPRQRSRVVLAETAIPSLDYQQLERPEIPELDTPETDPAPEEGEAEQ